MSEPSDMQASAMQLDAAAALQQQHVRFRLVRLFLGHGFSHVPLYIASQDEYDQDEHDANDDEQDELDDGVDAEDGDEEDQNADPSASSSSSSSATASSRYTLSRNKVDVFQRRIDRAVATGAPAEVIEALHAKLAAWQARVATRRPPPTTKRVRNTASSSSPASSSSSSSRRSRGAAVEYDDDDFADDEPEYRVVEGQRTRTGREVRGVARSEAAAEDAERRQRQRIKDEVWGRVCAEGNE
jgi:hypothetical protein